jgi:hypothetical protein
MSLTDAVDTARRQGDSRLGMKEVVSSAAIREEQRGEKFTEPTTTQRDNIPRGSDRAVHSSFASSDA